MSDNVESTATQAASPETQNEAPQTETSNESEALEALEQAASGEQELTPAQKKTLKSLKIKYNGKELEETLPFEIPDDEKAKEYMTRQLQLSKMAQAKAQEYSKLEKEIKGFVEGLRKDPLSILSDPNIGVDIKQVIDQYINQELENAKKTPEQIEREKLETELKKLKDEREKEKKQAEEREFERLQEQAYQRYDQGITEALSKSSLPKSEYVVSRIADYMLLGLQNGVDVQPQDVISLVESDIKNDLKQMFAVMPEDVVEALVGKDTINKLRKKTVAKAKEKLAPATVAKVVSKPQPASPKKTDSQPKVSIRKLFGV